MYLSREVWEKRFQHWQMQFFEYEIEKIDEYAENRIFCKKCIRKDKKQKILYA